jgi:hypothetical protein
LAVSLRDRGASAKETIETRARAAWHDIESDWRLTALRPIGSPLQAYVARSDRNFERVERFFYIGAGTLVIAGTAIAVSSALWGEPPKTVDPADIATPQMIASPLPGAARVGGAEAALTNLRSHERASIIAGPVEPTSKQERAASSQDGAEGAAAAQASNSLSSSITNLELDPDFLNEDIAGGRRKARRAVEDSASATTESEAQTGKCYVRIAGRVLNSGDCQISQKGGDVSFQYSGQTLTISPVKGKTWSLTLDGKNLGNVYKSGSCWASRSTYICDRG